MTARKLTLDKSMQYWLLAVERGKRKRALCERAVSVHTHSLLRYDPAVFPKD